MRNTNDANRLIAAGSIASTTMLADCRRYSTTALPVERQGSASPAALTAAPIDPTLPILVGAGKIASCAGTSDEATAAILDTMSGTVFATGDNVNSAWNALYDACADLVFNRHQGNCERFPPPHRITRIKNVIGCP
jgi:hypothetical protein